MTLSGRVAQALALEFSGARRASDRWGLPGAARITSHVAALLGQHVSTCTFSIPSRSRDPSRIVLLSGEVQHGKTFRSEWSAAREAR
jgi:hypothetical protein